MDMKTGDYYPICPMCGKDNLEKQPYIISTAGYEYTCKDCNWKGQPTTWEYKITKRK